MTWQFIVFANQARLNSSATWMLRIPTAPIWAAVASIGISAVLQIVVSIKTMRGDYADGSPTSADWTSGGSNLQPAVIGALGIAALFALILLQVPIGFAMITVGVVGFALQGGGWMPAFSFLAQEPSFVLSSTDLAAVPLFLLMGVFASVAGFSEDVYRAAAAFLGHRRGGLAYATIGGSAAFGAICGSSTATAATFGKVALPQMLDRGYSPAFSTGVIAAGGTLKSLIPPSLVMIIYCVVAKTFILDMFVAAVVPALMTIAFNLVAIAIVVQRPPNCHLWPPRLPEGTARCASAGGAIARAAPGRLCRYLQWHFYRKRGRFGRSGPCAAARPRAAPAELERAGSRHVRGGVRDRDAVFDPDGRADLHVFHQSGARSGRAGAVDRRPSVSAARSDFHVDAGLHSARHVFRGDVVYPYHPAADPADYRQSWI